MDFDSSSLQLYLSQSSPSEARLKGILFDSILGVFYASAIILETLKDVLRDPLRARATIATVRPVFASFFIHTSLIAVSLASYDSLQNIGSFYCPSTGGTLEMKGLPRSTWQKFSRLFLHSFASRR